MICLWITQLRGFAPTASVCVWSAAARQPTGMINLWLNMCGRESHAILIGVSNCTRFNARDQEAGPTSSRNAAGEAGSGSSSSSRSMGDSSLDAANRLDTALLELPGNNESTIRLLKARIRALEDQLQAAVDTASSGCMGSCPWLGHGVWWVVGVCRVAR